MPNTKDDNALSGELLSMIGSGREPSIDPDEGVTKPKIETPMQVPHPSEEFMYDTPLEHWVEPADLFRPLMLADLVEEMGNLPSLPTVVAYLINRSDDDLHIPEFIQMLSYDQVLTAKALRYANTAHMTNTAPVKTVAQAVARLGLVHLRKIISVAAISGMLVPQRCEEFNLSDFWRHSLATATISSAIADKLGYNATQAFTNGFLHDMGRVVLAYSYGSEYGEVIDYQALHGCSIVEAERLTIGIDHMEVGVELAKKWMLGDEIAESMSVHHEVDNPESRVDIKIQIVAFANILAHCEAFNDNNGADIELPAIPPVWTRMGWTDADTIVILRRAQRAYTEALLILAM